MVQHGHLPVIKSSSGLFNDEREKFMFICLAAGTCKCMKIIEIKSVQSSLKSHPLWVNLYGRIEVTQVYSGYSLYNFSNNSLCLIEFKDFINDR